MNPIQEEKVNKIIKEHLEKYSMNVNTDDYQNTSSLSGISNHPTGHFSYDYYDDQNDELENKNINFMGMNLNFKRFLCVIFLIIFFISSTIVTEVIVLYLLWWMLKYFIIAFIVSF